MPTLDLKELIATCAGVIDRSEKYQPLQWVAYRAMRHTGCREGEVCDLTRWSLTKVGQYELRTEKGKGVRTIEASDLPLEFRHWIAERKDGRAPTSVDRLRSSFRQMITWRSLTVGRKGVSTHLFRYTYIRQLAEDGLSVKDIMAHMALTSERVVEGYLNNEVIGE